MRKKHFYFIDESKPILQEKNMEIHCCVITTTPDSIRSSINLLKDELLNKSLYQSSWDQLKKSGFHACENHPNISDRFIDLLLTLNFRAYLVIAEKNSTVTHQNLIRKLLQDRLVKRRHDENHITFEQSLPKVTQDAKNKEAEKLTVFIKGFAPDIEVTVKVAEKLVEPLLSIPDYVAHIINNRFLVKNPKSYQLNHYEQICPKVACVVDYNQSRFFGLRNSGDKEKMIEYFYKLSLG